MIQLTAKYKDWKELAALMRCLNSRYVITSVSAPKDGTAWTRVYLKLYAKELFTKAQEGEIIN